MTEENYQYRTSQTMLRNQFEGEGIFKTPIIPKADFTDKEFENLLLIGFDRTRADDEKNCDRIFMEISGEGIRTISICKIYRWRIAFARKQWYHY